MEIHAGTAAYFIMLAVIASAAFVAAWIGANRR